MANLNPTIVVASLDDSLIKKSINELVQQVNDGAIQMAKSMDASVDSIMKSIQRLSSAKVGGSGSGGGGKSGSSSVTGDDTVKAMRNQIALEKEKREAMKMNSQELLVQNGEIQKMEQNLKRNLKTQADLNAEYRKDWQKREKANMQSAMSLSESSVSKMQVKIQEIENVVTRLRGKGILSEAEINRMTTKVEKLRDKIDKIKKQGDYAPKSTAAILGMPANTLDEINAKLQAIKQTRAKLDVEKQRDEINKLNEEAKKLTTTQNEILGKNTKLIESNRTLGGVLTYIRNRMIYALSMGASLSFVKQLYEIRGQYELLERSLGVLLNSFENGSRIFQELNNMAIKSPFTLIELAGAAKQLTAYNFEAKEVVDTTRRLADISAALGVPMERLTYNLGQIRAQTVLTARDARDFANAGLPIVKSLADYYTELEGKIVSTGDVYSRMSKKMVSYTDVMAVLNKMTDEGGKFFDFQAKQAQTLKVQMANLNLAFNNMLNDIGKGHQGLLSKPLQILKSLLENWRTIERAIWDVIWALGIYKATSIGLAMAIPANKIKDLSVSIASMVTGGNKLIGVFKSLGLAMKSLVMSKSTWIFAGVMAFVEVVQQLREAARATKELNNAIKTGADEASSSIGKFLKSNSAIRESSSKGKLSNQEAVKAWQSISDEIETSAASSNELLGELMKIDDVTERVRKGFDFVESIQKSQEALVKLQETTFSISQTVVSRLFGEGLVDDLQDYIDAIKELNERQASGKRTAYEEKDVRYATNELNYELEKVANQINNFISANNITDPLQINEIVERVRNNIKTNNPKIQGDLARAFDINLDEILSQQMKGYDGTKSITKYFVEDLKKGYSSAFGGLTDEMYESTFTWNDTQKKAIEDTLEKYKETMPEYYDEAVSLVNDISKLKAYIGIAFNVAQLSPFQQDFKQRIGANWDLRKFMPQATDDLPKWVETMQTAISDLEAKEKIYEKDKEKYSQQQLQDVKDELSLRKQALDLYHQSYYKEKKTSGKSEKDELGEALKQEISLIKDMQSNYEKLRKEGVGDFEAIELAARGYEATLERVNLVLSKYGIDKFNANQFAGKNVKELLEFLVKQRELLAKNPTVKTSAIEALDVEIQKLQVDAKTYDMKKITDGLNSKLAKIDEQYELAVELQANADLGNQLVDAFGLDVSDFPKTIDQYLQKYQDEVKNAISAAKPDANLADFDILSSNIVDLLKDSDKASTLVDTLLKKQEQARKTFQKWLGDTISGWDKLLEKYSEYEYKVNRTIEDAASERQTIVDKFGNKEQKDLAAQLTTNIKSTNDTSEKKKLEDQLKQLVKDVAGSDAAILNLTVAIDNKEAQEQASLSFEEFQKSPEWVAATGDLATMTRGALGMLIQELEEYKKKAKNLNPQQLKRLNSALRSLYKQQRSQSPFHEIADAIDQAKERMEDFDPAITEVEEQIKNLVEIQEKEGSLTEEQSAQLVTLRDKLEKLKNEQKELGQVSAGSIVDAINSSISAAKSAISIFNDMADALGGTAMTSAKETINSIFSVLDKAGTGAAIGAQIGEGKGAIIGAIGGALAGIVTTFADVLSGNRKITKQIEKSEKAVKRLELAYKDLENAVEHAYGVQEYGLQRIEIANKKAQLEEMKRQLQLEKSRKAKNYDEDKVLDMQAQIKDLEIEISNMTEEITNNILGLSSVGDAAEEMVSSMIDAFRSGEDYMDVFYKSFEDMIDSMIMKSIVARVIGERLDAIWNEVDARIKARSGVNQDEIDKKQLQITQIDKDINDLEGFMRSGAYKAIAGYEYGKELAQKLKGLYDMRKALENDINILSQAAPNQYLTPEDADFIRQKRDEMTQSVKDDFLAMMDAWGIAFGQDADSDSGSNLSALQQGIQGVSEQTANAIEGYMNSMWQQAYLRNELLTQIRDALILTDSDMAMGVQAQMLLQLQQSYQVQMAIQAILQGWSNANGMAVRVELI